MIKLITINNITITITSNNITINKSQLLRTRKKKGKKGTKDIDWNFESSQETAT